MHNWRPYASLLESSFKCQIKTGIARSSKSSLDSLTNTRQSQSCEGALRLNRCSCQLLRPDMQSPNIVERLAIYFMLSNENAGKRAQSRAYCHRPFWLFVDASNWEWKAKSRAIWKPAEESWRHFRAKWYGVTESQTASLVDSNSPSLSLEPLPSGFAPFISSIFVRNSYVSMFDIVWA